MSYPWVLHCFGFTAGLPWGDDPRVVDIVASTRAKAERISPVGPRGKASLTFNPVRSLRLSAITRKPITYQARIFVQRIGPWRQLVSVLGAGPNLDRRLLVGQVTPHVEELRMGAVDLGGLEPTQLQYSCALTCGDPYAFTFDKEERLSLRRAIARVEEARLPGEVQRRVVPGLPEELLVASAVNRLLTFEDAVPEVYRQLYGALRVESWGYLWKHRTSPELRDAPAMLQSPELTPAMYEVLSNVGETIVRALGLKPSMWSPKQELRGFEVITWALVAIRLGLPLDKAAKRVTDLLLKGARRA